jgi:tetratricopeptide (TPR) repeat protein
MPGNELPTGQARDLAAELRRLVRACEQRSGRKVDRASLARAVRISPQSLYAYLRGSRLPPAATLDALLIALGASSEHSRHLAGIRDEVEENRHSARSRPDVGAQRGVPPDTTGFAASGGAGAMHVPPTVPAAPQVRYSLPADTAVFTGRDQELRHVTAAVADAAAAGGVVAVGAIDGMPGVGKTTLAVHVAHVLRDRFPDRQLFIDLHAHTPGHDPVRPEEALAGLLAATGVDPRYLPVDLGGRAAMWRDRMTGQRALLVLDNAASSGQVAPLLPGSGRCLVLVTSRRHLGDLPGAVTPVPLDALPPQEAADMFTRLVPRAAGDRDGVAEVVALAGSLPLAISLLARVFARHPSWTLADLTAETRAGVLTMAAENNSVAAAFEVSYRHMDPGQQRLSRLISAHPGTVIDSYAVAALTGIGAAEAAGRLDDLHRESMLTEAGYRRYGMHDLVRRYARDLASADPVGSRQGQGRLLDYYQHTAALAATRMARQTRPGPPPSAPAGFEVPELDDAGQALAWARADLASLLACLDLATRTSQHARVIGLTAGLAALLRRDGPWAEAVARHCAAVAAARHLGDRLGQANALTDLAGVRKATGDLPGAAGNLEQALGIYRDLDSRLGEANALNSLAILRRTTGDHGAVRDFERALGIYRDLGDRLGEANALTDLGAVRREMGDYPGAAATLEEALNVSRETGDRVGLAHALTDLGAVVQATGDYPGAAAAFEQALGIYRDLGDRLGEANALRHLGDVRQVTGDYPGAVGILDEALGIYRDLGSRLGEANALRNLGTGLRLTGDYPGAARALEEALGIYRDIGDRQGQAEALDEQATLHLVRGDLTQAMEHHQQALDLARAIGISREEARALAGLGRCARAARRTTEAQVLLRQAHKILHRIGAAEARDVLTELGALNLPASAR